MINDGLDGGGTEIYKEVAYLLQNWYPNGFNRTFEWCSGPGKIGLHLLENNLTNSLCLADIHEPAVNAHRKYIKERQLENKVTSYLSDNLKQIPTTEKWDLVVSNPPHFSSPIHAWSHVDERLYVDWNWQLHKDFLLNVKPYLNPRAKIFLWEAAIGSSVKTFSKWFEEGGLKILNYGNSETSHDHTYWYWILLENT